MTDYYIAAAGSDTNSGTFSGSPWQHISKVNGVTFSAGDTINFNGGDTFNDSQLWIQQSGSSGNPITIQSYGTGNATLSYSSTSADAIYLQDVSYITIQNLNIASTAGFASVKNGIEFWGSTGQAQGLLIQNCTISGYIAGIMIGGSANLKGTAGLQILNVTAHDNQGYGIFLYGTSTFTSGQYQHSQFTISGCVTYNNNGNSSNTSNATGYGICIGGAGGTTSYVENCIAHDNGSLNGNTGGGPVGIMIYNSNLVTVQNCLSYNNSSGTSVDGDGLDLDINCSNCVLQWNISYNNKGAGILLWGSSSNTNWTGNRVRWNLCWGNSKGNAYAEIYIGQSVSGTDIFNNTCYTNGTSAPCVYVNSTGTKSLIRINNNVLYSGRSTSAAPLVQALSAFTSTQVYFQGNLYYTPGSFQVKWGSNTRTSLSSWQSSDSQEKSAGSAVGYQGNPQMLAPTVSPAVTSLSDLTGCYNLSYYSTSPAASHGLDVASLLSISIGNEDLVGNTAMPSPNESQGAILPVYNQSLFMELSPDIL